MFWLAKGATRLEHLLVAVAKFHMLSDSPCKKLRRLPRRLARPSSPNTGFQKLAIANSSSLSLDHLSIYFPYLPLAFLTNTMANTSKRNFGKMRRSVAPTKQEGVNGKKKSTRTKGMGCRRRGCFRPAARYQRCRHRLILRAHFSQRYLWRSQAPPEEGRI